MIQINNVREIWPNSVIAVAIAQILKEDICIVWMPTYENGYKDSLYIKSFYEKEGSDIRFNVMGKIALKIDKPISYITNNENDILFKRLQNLKSSVTEFDSSAVDNIKNFINHFGEFISVYDINDIIRIAGAIATINGDELINLNHIHEACYYNRGYLERYYNIISENERVVIFGTITIDKLSLTYSDAKNVIEYLKNKIL